MSRRIVLTTFGSLGDLHPYVAIALGLKARGHEVILATSEFYREKIGVLGLGFHPTRPDSDFTTDPRRMRRYMATRTGTVTVVREVFLPVLRQSYDDLVVACRDADLLVSHMPWAARMVAEKTGIPWVSTMITPMGFFSVHDLPTFPLTPGISKALRGLGMGPWLWSKIFRTLLFVGRPVAWPIYRLRRELGLPKCRDWNPLNESHSPQLGLALFSKLLGAPQPDWPANTVQTGFPVYDQDGGSQLPDEVERFLAAGPPPIVFTLGISAAMVADQFFEHSIAAAKTLGRRAILATGRHPLNRLSHLPEGMLACEYAPFSKLFPRAAAIVHPGGIGTTGLAMRSGRPTLMVPYAHDQPDNALRCERLGFARAISPKGYTSGRVARELQELLENPQYAERGTQVREELLREDGVAAACDAIERLLESPHK